MDGVLQLAPGLVWRLPMVLVMAVGFFIAIIRWRQLPIASLILIVVLPIWGLLTLSLAIVHQYLSTMSAAAMMSDGGEALPEYFGAIAIGTNCASVLIDAVALALILLAVFVPRPVPRNNSQPEG